MQDLFHIRPVRNGDTDEEEALIALVNRCYRSSDNWTNEANIVSGQRLTLPRLGKYLEQFQIFVAEETRSKKLAACVKTGVTKESLVGPLEDKAGYLGLLAVGPDYQRQGLGSHLVRFAEQHCVEKGMTNMILDVLDVRSDVIEWYERRGYRRTGQSMDAAPFIKNKGEVLLVPSSFIVMAKELVRNDI